MGYFSNKMEFRYQPEKRELGIYQVNFTGAEREALRARSDEDKKYEGAYAIVLAELLQFADQIKAVVGNKQTTASIDQFLKNHSEFTARRQLTGGEKTLGFIPNSLFKETVLGRGMTDDFENIAVKVMDGEDSGLIWWYGFRKSVNQNEKANPAADFTAKVERLYQESQTGPGKTSPAGFLSSANLPFSELFLTARSESRVDVGHIKLTLPGLKLALQFIGDRVLIFEQASELLIKEFTAKPDETIEIGRSNLIPKRFDRVSRAQFALKYENKQWHIRNLSKKSQTLRGESAISDTFTPISAEPLLPLLRPNIPSEEIMQKILGEFANEKISLTEVANLLNYQQTVIQYNFLGKENDLNRHPRPETEKGVREIAKRYGFDLDNHKSVGDLKKALDRYVNADENEKNITNAMPYLRDLKRIQEEVLEGDPADLRLKKGLSAQRINALSLRLGGIIAQMKRKGLDLSVPFFKQAGALSDLLSNEYLNRVEAGRKEKLAEFYQSREAEILKAYAWAQSKGLPSSIVGDIAKAIESFELRYGVGDRASRGSEYFDAFEKDTGLNLRGEKNELRDFFINADPENLPSARSDVRTAKLFQTGNFTTAKGKHAHRADVYELDNGEYVTRIMFGSKDGAGFPVYLKGRPILDSESRLIVRKQGQYREELKTTSGLIALWLDEDGRLAKDPSIFEQGRLDEKDPLIGVILAADSESAAQYQKVKDALSADQALAKSVADAVKNYNNVNDLGSDVLEKLYAALGISSFDDNADSMVDEFLRKNLGSLAADFGSRAEANLKEGLATVYLSKDMEKLFSLENSFNNFKKSDDHLEYSRFAEKLLLARAQVYLKDHPQKELSAVQTDPSILITMANIFILGADMASDDYSIFSKIEKDSNVEDKIMAQIKERLGPRLPAIESRGKAFQVFNMIYSQMIAELDSFRDETSARSDARVTSEQVSAKIVNYFVKLGLSQTDAEAQAKELAAETAKIAKEGGWDSVEKRVRSLITVLKAQAGKSSGEVKIKQEKMIAFLTQIADNFFANTKDLPKLTAGFDLQGDETRLENALTDKNVRKILELIYISKGMRKLAVDGLNFQQIAIQKIGNRAPTASNNRIIPVWTGQSLEGQDYAVPVHSTGGEDLSEEVFFNTSAYIIEILASAVIFGSAAIQSKQDLGNKAKRDQVRADLKERLFKNPAVAEMLTQDELEQLLQFDQDSINFNRDTLFKIVNEYQAEEAAKQAA